MRWILSAALLLVLSACNDPPLSTSNAWVKADGTALTGTETQQATVACSGRVGDMPYLQQTPAFTSPGSFQQFNEQFQTSPSFGQSTKAEFNTCMSGLGYTQVQTQ
jgi:hypothetical protein